MPKHAIRVIKKKFTSKSIVYKIEWSNGSISYEPFTEIEPELLPLIQTFELNATKGNSDKNLKQIQEKQLKEHQIVQKKENEQRQKVMRQERSNKLRSSINDEDSRLKKQTDFDAKIIKKVKSSSQGTSFQGKKKDQSKVNKSNILQFFKIKEPNNQSLNQQNPEESGITKVQHSHQPKKTVACTIKQIRKINEQNNNLEFLVSFEKKKDEIWMDQNLIRSKAPVALCDYLLDKVKWNKQQ